MRKLIVHAAISAAIACSSGNVWAKNGPVADASAKKQSQSENCPPRESAQARSSACDKNHSNARFCRDEPDNQVGQCKQGS